MTDQITKNEYFISFESRLRDLDWSDFEKFEATVHYLYKVYGLFFTKVNYKRYKEHVRIVKEIVNKNSFNYETPLKIEFYFRYVKSIWACCNSSDYELLAHLAYEFSKRTDIVKIIELADKFVTNKE